MQDRFKFRTYIPQKKFFKFWGWLKKGEYRGLCPSDDTSLDELLEKYTNQCTGLKDKNGKLVYEGDIVKLSDGSINGSILEFIKVVEWKTNKWNIPNWIKDDCDNTHFIEIIGNIYQDSHLLDKSKSQAILEL